MAVQDDNPFRDCRTIRQLMDQLAGAGSACWDEVAVDVPVEGAGGSFIGVKKKTERVFNSELAIRFSSYAIAKLRDLIVCNGGKWPDENRKDRDEGSPPGRYAGLTIIQRIEAMLAEVSEEHAKEVQTVAINPESDEGQMIYLEGMKEGINNVLAIFQGGSGVEEGF